MLCSEAESSNGDMATYIYMVEFGQPSLLSRALLQVSELDQPSILLGKFIWVKNRSNIASTIYIPIAE